MSGNDDLHPICIFGEVLFDIFPDGVQVLGGAPFNVAWHLQALGQEPRFVSRVGEDPEAARIRAAMHDWGMSLQSLESDPEHPSGRVSVSLEGGEPSYDIVEPCAYDFIALDAPGGLPDCGLLYHGSLAVRNAVSAASLERLKAAGPGQVFVDVNLRAPWWSRDQVLALVRDADWAKLNRDELALLAGVPGRVSEQARRVKEDNQLTGVIVTLGAEGALALGEEEQVAEVAPPPSLEVVDAVGAGDAFAAVLILGIRRGWPLATTLERAQALASRIVGQRGATVSDPDFYRPFIEDWALTAPA